MSGKNNHEHITHLFAAGEELVFAKGETIPTHDAIYLLEDGYVGMYQDKGDIHKRMLFIYCQDEMFPYPYQEHITDKVAHVSYCAIDTVKVRKLSWREFEAALRGDAQFGVAVLRKFSMILDMILGRIANLEQSNAFDRLTSRLVFSARRFGVPDKGRTIIDIPLTHTDIALSIGVTRETVNRFMRQLEKQGYIEVRDRKIIVSDVFLKKYAES
jgi:CRP-like cAMP-binding protein